MTTETETEGVCSNCGAPLTDAVEFEPIQPQYGLPSAFDGKYLCGECWHELREKAGYND